MPSSSNQSYLKQRHLQFSLHTLTAKPSCLPVSVTANLNEFLRVEALRPLLPAEWQPAVFAHDTDIDQLESPQLHGGVVSSASPSGPGSELSTASGVVHGEDAKATFGIESHGRDGPNMGSGKGKEQSPRGEHCRGRSPLLVFERDECGGWRVNPKTIAKLDASENAGFKTVGTASAGIE